MDYYEIWCNLKNGGADLEFAANVERYLGHLRDKGLIEGYSLKRRKLGFGLPELGEFNITIMTRDLAQLEQAFQRAASRDAEVEPFHQAVYSMVKDARFALYRDFPDAVREWPK
jgi:hypothetical protein